MSQAILPLVGASSAACGGPSFRSPDGTAPRPIDALPICNTQVRFPFHTDVVIVYALSFNRSAQLDEIISSKRRLPTRYARSSFHLFSFLFFVLYNIYLRYILSLSGLRFYCDIFAFLEALRPSALQRGEPQSTFFFFFSSSYLLPIISRARILLRYLLLLFRVNNS